MPSPSRARCPDGEALVTILMEEVSKAAFCKALTKNARLSLFPNREMWRRIAEVAPNFSFTRKVWEAAVDKLLESNEGVQAGLIIYYNVIYIIQKPFFHFTFLSKVGKV